MPELPEVETIARDLLKAGIVGRTLACARVFWKKAIAEPSVPDFCRLIRRRTIAGVRRRGKFLVLDLSGGGNLLIHLRMSGRLHWLHRDAARQPHEHVLLGFSDGSELRLHDTRKFGRIYLTPEADAILGRLGPEPLDPSFTAAQLQSMLNSRRRQLKPLLLDQTFIAGIGNIYADEALWESRLHPLQSSKALTEPEVAGLHAAIRRVLRRGLKNLGTSLGTGKANFYSVGRRRGRNRDALNVFRRTGAPCPRCATPIRRIVVGQRSTHLCPQCQTVRTGGGSGRRGESTGRPVRVE
jgi:formamidopyrimidine-DNA glycosylase